MSAQATGEVMKTCLPSALELSNDVTVIDGAKI